MAGINIRLRDKIGSLGAAILPILRAWIVLLGPRTRSRPSDLTLNAKNVVAHLHTDIAQFSPVLSPGVSNDPMSIFLARTIKTDDRDYVIRIFGGRLILEHAPTVIDDGFGIDHGSDRPTSVDLSHDLVNVTIVDQTVLGNGGIGEHINFRAGSAHTREGVASLASVESRACCVDMGTETLGTLGRTGHVGQTGVERNITGVLNELIS
mmetsp:Transcript_538/g.913  ORF Transcript_538/g.913 Transcript_538/m.913 type:complete len:208 (+) Transcript_538:262-885(+)